MTEAELRDKLRKIEALFAGAGSSREKMAAQAARERIQEKLQALKKNSYIIEMVFYLQDLWARKLFVALCRRYSLRPYRYGRQRYTTVVIKAPEKFIKEVLWPEYQALFKVLNAYLTEATDNIIRQEIFNDTTEAEERMPLPK